MSRKSSPGAETGTDEPSPADWLRGRLTSPSEHVVTSWVPSGFDGYVKILHPIPVRGDRAETIRWADVSRWSQVPLHPTIQWHDVVLPELIPPLPKPWRSQGPREGSLSRADADALIDDLSPVTTGMCWFAVWDGYGPIDTRPHLEMDEPAKALQPKWSFTLPWRDYELFDGPLLDATAFAMPGFDFQSPNLWWPDDHAWCVASEIDLPWTYVGGSRDVIDTLLGDDRLELLEVLHDDPIVADVAEWLRERIDVAAERVIRTGSAKMNLAAGEVDLKLESRGRRKSVLIARSIREGGGASTTRPISTKRSDDRLEQVRCAIQRAVIALTQA
jgi:hypothetical protein